MTFIEKSTIFFCHTVAVTSTIDIHPFHLPPLNMTTIQPQAAKACAVDHLGHLHGGSVDVVGEAVELTTCHCQRPRTSSASAGNVGDFQWVHMDWDMPLNIQKIV